MNIAIILCSGIGKRMGAGKNKVLLKLGGKPLVYYALLAFEKNKNIGKIILTCGKDEIGVFQKIVEKYRFRKVAGIIEGGQERQHSAALGLEYAGNNIKPKKNDVVIFHNGANPFVSQNDIIEGVKFCQKTGASVIAHPTKDTIKEADEKGLVFKTLDRKKLWSMQTPQCMRFGLALRAFSRAKEDNFLGTDDVSLVERIGGKVKIIKGSLYNFKITTALDLELAKIILNKYYKKNV